MRRLQVAGWWAPGTSGRAAAALVPLAALHALCPAAACSAPKVDLLILQNGDRVTGEVKKLDLCKGPLGESTPFHHRGI